MSHSDGGQFMKHAICGALFLVVACALPNAHTQEPDSDESLIGLLGLRGVTVYVEEPDSILIDHGITASVLQTPVELRLRQNEIPVLNQGDEGSATGNPVLYVTVSGILNEEMHQYAYQIQMELTQTVLLERDSAVSVADATTWRTGGVALSGPQWRDSLLEDLDFFTEKFINAYWRVNGDE
jgi:hypothetical protein